MIITFIHIISRFKNFAIPSLKKFIQSDKISPLSVPEQVRDNPTPKGGNSMVITFIVSVVAGVASHYICKWLDRHFKR